MIKKLILITYLILCIFDASSQHKKRLIKNWEFLKQDLGGIWEAVRPVGKGNPESVPLWSSVTLPHCINAIDAVDPDLNYYQGPAWYRTQLDIDNPFTNGKTILHFEGAGQKTQVYIYSTKVGEHTGGYDEWSVDITEAVNAFKTNPAFSKQFNNKIPISIRTDNSRDLEMIPSSLSDFTIYGGIYRYLNLIYEPAVSCDKILISSEIDKDKKSGTVKTKTLLYNPSHAEVDIATITLLDPGGKVLQKKIIQITNPLSTDTIFSTFTMKNPLLWSTASPTRYTVELVLQTKSGLTKHTEKFGFRNFEFVSKGPFMLNEKRLLLRGTHRHEDHARVGSAMSESMIRQEMIMMKEMGVNFIRLGHYQQSRIVLNLCDSLGILVWEEIPWCRGGLGGDVYKQQARQMLGNMIAQHFNHPSIIIWGLGNENDWPGDFAEFDKEKIRTFMKELNAIAHHLDQSRKTAIRRCDFCKDIVDVYSPSIWAGWYRGVYTEYKEISEKEFNSVNHFLHVEWGGDSHAGRHSENPDRALTKIRTGEGGDERAGDASLFGGSARISKDGDWSESYICNLIDWHLKEQETMPWLTGTAYWPFKDFATPVRPDNPVPYVNQKGVVERDFTKKEAYYVFQSWWTDKAMVHIYGHSWPVRWGESDEEKMLKVYSNCDNVELFLNGVSYGVKNRNAQDFPAAGLRWQAKFTEGENKIHVVAKKGKTIVIDDLVFDYQTKKWNKPAKLSVEKVSEEKGILKIIVKILDANNTLCLDATNWIRFGITGDGILLDNQGTSQGSRLVQLYNGRAYISVNTNSGKSVLSVQSKDLQTEFISIDH